MKQLIWSLMAFTLIFSSCGEEEEPLDNIKPVIREIKINDEDAHHDGHDHGHEKFEMASGAATEVEWEVNDDIELSELRMDIHANFDGHSHGKKAGDYELFSWEKIISLSGKLQSGSESIDVPNDILGGPYHLDILLLDKTGNVSESVLIDVMITHPSQPTFSLKTPAEPIVAAKGGNFELTGDVVDDEDLEEVIIELIPHDGGDHIFEKEIELKDQVETTYEVKEMIGIPSDAEAGEYELIIKIKDHDGHMSIVEYEIEVN
jgi:hypothetical protein